MISYNFQAFLRRQGIQLTDTEVHQVYSVCVPSSLRPWLAGGSIRRLITNQAPSDYDFFFHNENERNQVLEHTKRNFPNAKFRENNYNTTVIVDDVILKATIQFIKIGYYNNVEALLNSFDYTICQFAWDGHSNFSCGDFSLWDLARKRLVVNKITYPVASLRRLLKYTNQGFYACEGCLSELLQQAAEVDISNFNVRYVD